MHSLYVSLLLLLLVATETSSDSIPVLTWIGELREFLKILLSWPAVALWGLLFLLEPITRLIDRVKSIGFKDLVKINVERVEQTTQEIKKKILAGELEKDLESDLQKELQK